MARTAAMRVAYLLRVVDERARGESVRDVFGFQRLTQVRQRGARRHQDGDVGELRRAPLARSGVVHRPSVRTRTNVGDDAGHIGGFGLAQRPRLHLRIRMGTAEQHRSVIDADVAARANCSTARTWAARRSKRV